MPVSRSLVLGSVILALAACGGQEQTHGKDRKRGAPPGLELAMSGAAQASQAYVLDVSVDDVARELAAGSIRLIDIRTPEEVAESGPIPGAEHIPLEQLDLSLLHTGDGREVVLYCRTGARSEVAAGKLAEQTGRPVAHMKGGITAWAERTRLAQCRQPDQDAC